MLSTGDFINVTVLIKGSLFNKGGNDLLKLFVL